MSFILRLHLSYVYSIKMFFNKMVLDGNRQLKNNFFLVCLLFKPSLSFLLALPNWTERVYNQVSGISELLDSRNCALLTAVPSRLAQAGTPISVTGKVELEQETVNDKASFFCRVGGSLFSVRVGGSLRVSCRMSNLCGDVYWTLLNLCLSRLHSFFKAPLSSHHLCEVFLVLLFHSFPYTFDINHTQLPLQLFICSTLPIKM